MIKLRAYQNRAVENVLSNMLKYRHIALYLPQGAGKSIVLAYMALGAMKKKNKVLILTHRQEILMQNMSKMESFGLNVQAVTAKTKSIDLNVDCYCAMSQTIASRIKKHQSWRDWLFSIPFVIIDECHINNHNVVLDATNPNSYRVGLSASMLRSGGSQAQLANYYDTIVKGDSTKELIDLGFLTPSRNFAFQAPKMDNVRISYSTGDYSQTQMQKVFRKKERYSGIIENYNKLAPNTKAIVFTTGSEHCVDITKMFNEAGIKAKYLLSNKMPETDEEFSGEREQLLRDFADNKFKVLVNISILDTGFDEPSIETVILDFSTTSYARYSQAVGRGSRLFHGKEYFNVLDFGNNIQTHGIYEQPNPPMSLWHKVGGNGVAPTKECPIDKGGCGRLLLVSATDCKWCGYHFPTQKEIYNVELTEIIDNSETDDMNKWIAEQMLKGKNPNWILVNICIKNPLNQKAAFMEAIKVLRKADGGQFSPKYWHFFKKNILDRKKKNIEKLNK